MGIVIKDVELHVVRGIFGCAVLDIKETLSAYSPDQSNNISGDLVREDIQTWFDIEAWSNMFLTDMPEEPGAYTFVGSVRFDPDETTPEYSLKCKNSNEQQVSYEKVNSVRYEKLTTYFLSDRTDMDNEIVACDSLSELNKVIDQL